MKAGKIVVTSKVFAQTLELLSQWGEPLANDTIDPWPKDELLQKAQDAVAIMAFMPDVVDGAFLDACPRLRIVSCALKGYDNFDVEACTERGVWLTVVPNLLTKPTAEFALGLMLALSRHVLTGDDLVRSGQYAGWRPILYGKSIDGSSVGILGGGAIGKEIARKLAGFDCRVLVYDHDTKSTLPSNARWASMQEVLEEADYLIVALPLGPTTIHLINDDVLSRVKPDCLLINVARGSLVNEAQVVSALRSGRLGGYAADVFEFEDKNRQSTPRQIHPELLEMRHKTVLTAHLGSAVTQVRMEIERDAAMNIGEALTGRRPHGAVNDVPRTE